jgi:hypothetical protein
MKLATDCGRSNNYTNRRVVAELAESESKEHSSIAVKDLVAGIGAGERGSLV